MQKYKEFSPTQFDPKGLNADRYDIGEFLVVPVSRNRDSGPLEESNFNAALLELGGESELVQVHRFGHWGNGWFELILVDPTSDKAIVAEEIEASLEDYPVLDDSDFSAREWEAAEEYYANMSLRERMEVCQEYGESIFAARASSLSEFARRASSAHQRICDRSVSNY
jgi:hypothetical protein